MRTALAFLLVAALAAGCGSSANSGGTNQPVATPSAPATATAPAVPTSPTLPASTAQSSGTTIKTGNSDLGEVLFDASGQAIYIWEVEKSEQPQCYGDCEQAWPPVLTGGAPVAAGLVNATLLGTTSRTDGSRQVTYAGHPLYFYAHEGKNEVKCHKVRTHGGLWWAVAPGGSAAP